jgi:hypothetical protein
MTALAAAYPIKRTFDRPFGRVMTRYGETGNTEKFIDTRDDPRTVEYERDVQAEKRRRALRLFEQAGERISGPASSVM